MSATTIYGFVAHGVIFGALGFELWYMGTSPNGDEPAW